MTLKDLGPQALVYRNIFLSTTSISDERLWRYKLGWMDKTATICSPRNFFEKAVKSSRN
jgi:hypothetical protein